MECDGNTPADRLRLRWAATLAAYLTARGMNQKQFRLALADHGCKVSRQAIDQWLSGQTAPRPAHQAAIAAVFQAPVHVLFPIEAVA